MTGLPEILTGYSDINGELNTVAAVVWDWVSFGKNML